MGKYDSLRQAVGGSIQSETTPKKKSKYDDLRMSMGLIEDTRPEPVQSPDAMESTFRQEAQSTPELQPQVELQTDPGAADSMVRQENKVLPGRNLPVIGPVLQGLDWIASNPVSEAIAEYTVPDQTMIENGKVIPGTNARDAFMQRSGQVESAGASKFIGQAAAPFFVPGAGLGAGSPYRPAAEVLTSRMPQGLGQVAAREAAIGAPLGFGYEYAQGQGDLGNAAMYGALGAGLGGVLGAAGPLLGKSLQGTRLGKVFNRSPIEETAGDMLSLPSPRPKANEALPMGRIPSGEPIATPYTFKLPNASDETIQGVRQLSDAQTGIRETTNELKLLEDRRASAVIDQYKLLKEQMANRGGVQQGSLINDAEGSVIGRTGRVSNNPKWFQEFHAANGRNPTNKDLMELAKKHVDEGYQDEATFIPPWKEQVGFEDSVNALNQVRGELRDYVKGNGLGLTDSELKTSQVGFKNAEKSISPIKQSSKLNTVDEQNIKTVSKPVSETPVKANPAEPVLKSSPEPESVIDDLIQTKEPRLRDKVYNLLDEQEKAARGRLAAKKGRLSSMPIDQWADHAVILAAQIGKGGIKAADAAEYLVKEFGESIRPHANEILAKARRIAKDTERRATKEAQAARDFNSSGVGDADTANKKISRDVKKKVVPFSEKYEKMRTALTDDLAPLEGLVKKVRGRADGSAESNLYKSARLYRGAPAKANQIVVDRLTPIINAVEKAGFTSDDLGTYAINVHAKDVNANDIISGFTNKEIDDVIAKYGTPEMEAARKELVKIGDDMLSELADSGVISKDLMATLRERYKNYIPLFREMDDAKVEFGRGVSDSLANVTSPIKALKGSEKNVIDPLENMVKNIYQSVNAAERNKVARQLSTLAKEDVDQTFIRKLDNNEVVGRKNVVSVLEDGEKVQYEVEPEVYKALLSLDKESSNMLIKILQKPASLLRAGATLTPEFSLRNPMRDVVQAFVVSKSGFNPIVDFPAGLFETITKGKYYKQWVNEMGDFGNIMSVDRNATNEALKKVLGEPVSKKFVNIVNGKTLINVLRAIADTTESATKVGEFRAALRKGVTPQEAAYRSRDIMDFGRAGTGIRQANKIVAFLNANIQGKSKLIRAFKENPVGVTTRSFTAVTLPTIGIYVMQKTMANDAQKQTIEETPDWMKNAFWLMPVPGTDQVARIPKPFDLAAIFSNAPERALKYIYDNDKEAFDKFAQQSLSEAALPNQISGLLPFIEGMAGYSFFRQGDIVPLGEQSREYKDQFGIDTTETAKFLAAGANKLTGGEGSFKNFSSPRVMDNTIKGLTAGLGTYATSAIDVLLDKIGVTDNPKRPDKGVALQPLARAFLVNPLQSGKSTEQLYNLKDKLSKEKSSATANETDFDSDKEMKLKYINRQTKFMSQITKEIRAAETDRTLTPAQKRKEIDYLTRERNQVSKDAIKELKEW